MTLLLTCRFCFHPCRCAAVGFLAVVVWVTACSDLIACRWQPGDDLADGANHLRPSAVDDGWISLFDGKTLFGWKAESKVDWQAVDGSIVATKGQLGLLRTTSQFSNFELSIDYRASDSANSGVFVRTSPRPVRPESDCLEINIAPDDNPFPTGSVVKRQRFAVQRTKKNQWNTMRISLDGGQGKVWVNRSYCGQFQADDLGRGYVGLQFREGKIAFRNIFLRPLRLNPIFNGRDLNGWSDAKSRETKFSVDSNGQLRMQSGPGQLESDQQFSDFVLQLKCKTNAVGLNSGVFFRCIPGDFMNGYESQIQNEMVDNDPKSPKDCGTGGIFRRQDARQIVAQDLAWFTKTIVAVGPHISVWVNGVQVSDWTDQRKPDPNPRKGRRLQEGTICLQGHDPTTDILIQRIDVAELDPRRR